jgi:prepilin-type N-terminal cleavage/methylation domain-containing protein
MNPRRVASKARLRSRLRNIRRGFTLIEMIVAIMVFATGVLSLAAGATVVATMLGGAAQQTRVATIVQSRFDQVRVTACNQLSSGSQTTRGVVESWNVTDIPRGRRVTVAVQYYREHRLKSQNFETSIPC